MASAQAAPTQGQAAARMKRVCTSAAAPSRVTPTAALTMRTVGAIAGPTMALSAVMARKQMPVTARVRGASRCDTDSRNASRCSVPMVTNVHPPAHRPYARTGPNRPITLAPVSTARAPESTARAMPPSPARQRAHLLAEWALVAGSEARRATTSAHSPGVGSGFLTVFPAPTYLCGAPTASTADAPETVARTRSGSERVPRGPWPAVRLRLTMRLLPGLSR